MYLCPLEKFSAIPADYIDLSYCPDDGSAAGADIFDTAILGFFTPAFGGVFHRQAAGVNFILTQIFSDPCLRASVVTVHPYLSCFSMYRP